MLGLALVAGGVAGGLGPDDFPGPVSTSLILVVGAALVALGALLWRLAERIDLRTLATANAATAAAAGAWYLAAGGFSAAGATLTLVTAGALVLLAAAQLLARPS